MASSRRFRALLAAVPALLVLGFGTPATAERPFSFESTPGKLPKDVRPLAYRIEVVPNLERLVFGGREEVDIQVSRPTDTISLNAVDLVFGEIALDGDSGRQPEIKVDAATQVATFRFPRTIAPGRHTLSIAYTGKISAQPAGIYYADYDTPRGRKRLLTTQFEAADARRMFPGWDEPAFKATFSLSTIVPDTFRAISNMPVAREEPGGPGRKKVTFATTPRMSSYLLVLTAGELDRISRTVDGVEIAVDAAQGKAEQGRYALDAAAEILPYYNDYFGVKYPLPKLDLIAIPGNFVFGAMENWGGITYIDNTLLFDPANSTPRTREVLFIYTTHEMAHQWSGDLVTMAWWDNVWLNEGFASWMEKKAADHFNPTWKIWLRAHDDKELALEIDARRTTHPVQQAIHDESEADASFDDITYNKGQSFVRMIESYLGESAFRDGMRRYMKAHAYSNTTTADLWAAFEQSSGKPIARIAAGFTEQPGVPLIQVASRCDGGETVATLSGGRFTVHDPSAATLRWEVPVTIGRPDDSAPRTVLVGAQPETVRFPGCGAPVKANFGDVGYYRTEYDPAGLMALTRSYAALAPADRVNLLADLYAMVEAGRADAGTYLDLTLQLANETELTVWTDLVEAFREIDDLERGSPDRAAFRTHARSLLRPALDRIGWDARAADDAEAPLLRAMLIRMLGRFDDGDVIAEARRRFAAFLKDPATLPPALQEPVMAVVSHNADRATFDALRQRGRAASSTEGKLRFYNALGGARDPALIDEVVKITTTDEIPNGRINLYIAKAAAASDDPDRVWKLFLAARGPVEEKLTSHMRDGLLPLVASASSNPAVAAELAKLPEAQSTAAARNETAKAIEEIAFKAEYRERLLPSVHRWLQANTHGPSSQGRSIQ